MGPKAGHASGCLDRVPGPRADTCCVFYGWIILAVCISVKVVGTSAAHDHLHGAGHDVSAPEITRTTGP